MRSNPPLALAALLVAGCADFRIASQEVRARYDADADACELLIVSTGLAPLDVNAERDPAQRGGLFQHGPKDPEKALERALGALEDYADGARRFQSPFAPGLQLDVDGWVADAPSDEELGQRLVALLDELRVLEAGAFAYRDGLGIWQHVRVPRVRPWIAFVNESWSYAVLADLAENVESDDREAEVDRVLAWADGLFDRRSAVRWIERARSDEPWIALAGGRLRVDLPVTRPVANELLRRAFAGAALQEELDGTSLLAMLLVSVGRHVAALQIGDERTLLELAPTPSGESGDVVLRTGGERMPFDPALLAAWRERGHPLADVDPRALAERLGR